MNEPNFCEICCRYKTAPVEFPNNSVCCCKGLQPYSMSTYPGEHSLTKSHPANDGEQWYKRVEADEMIELLESASKQASLVHDTISQITGIKCLPSQMPRFLEDHLAALKLRAEKAEAAGVMKDDCIKWLILNPNAEGLAKESMTHKALSTTCDSELLKELDEARKDVKRLDWLAHSSSSESDEVNAICNASTVLSNKNWLEKLPEVYRDAIDQVMKEDGK